MEGFDEKRACLYRRSGSSSAYQEDFLGIFKLDEWDGQQISRVVDRFVERYGEEEWFLSVLNKSPFFDPGDKATSLSGLFNYDQMDVLHTILARAVSGEVMTGDGVVKLIERLTLK